MTPALLIRLALLAGVLMFGGVTWYIRREGAGPGLDPETLRTLLWVGRGTWILSMATCVSLFGMLRNARSQARIGALSLVGWAAGEAVAMVGGVIWFLTGITQWYSAGLVYLVLTFLAFPARRE
ncbi:MAG: hypothetical protein IT360_13595 [Gemmatimonadaceae bacterium]|nr:hypothetical protein [Gemmatimonadaceae bacterium]